LLGSHQGYARRVPVRYERLVERGDGYHRTEVSVK
jgi:hypothetical protein